MKKIKRSRPTLKDIARDVGVHVSTISRALNPKSTHGVSTDLAEKIHHASNRRGYKPNAAAYMLRTNRSRTIGVVVPDITDPVFPPIIRGIEDGLARQGYVAILANTDGDPRRQIQVIEAMRARGIDGLIVASVTRHDEDVSRLTAGIPVVTVSRRTDDPAFRRSCTTRTMASAAPSRISLPSATARIAAIAGPQTVSTGFNRYSSYVRHSEEFGLGLKQPLVVIRTSLQRNGGRALRRGTAGGRAAVHGGRLRQ